MILAPDINIQTCLLTYLLTYLPQFQCLTCTEKVGLGLFLGVCGNVWTLSDGQPAHRHWQVCLTE